MDQFNNAGLAPTRTNFDSESQDGSNPILENIKGKVAEGLKNAAASLQQKAPQNGPMSDYAAQASGWLGKAGDYVEDINPSQVKSDIQNQMRANPGRTLLIAGAVGLIIGTLFRRR